MFIRPYAWAKYSTTDRGSGAGHFFIFAKHEEGLGMKIAFIVFDGMTTLDFIGFYDAVTRVSRMNVRIARR